MGSCLTTSYTCFCAVCLLEELFVAGRVVSWGRWEASELGRWERGGRVVSCEGEKGGRLVTWEGGKSGGVVRWQDWRSGRVVRW